jgi:hypothetical protein
MAFPGVQLPQLASLAEYHAGKGIRSQMEKYEILVEQPTAHL